MILGYDDCDVIAATAEEGFVELFDAMTAARQAAADPGARLRSIGKAYVHAVAARHGFKIGTWSVDDGCLDVTIGSALTLSRVCWITAARCASTCSKVDSEFIRSMRNVRIRSGRKPGST